MSQNAHEAWQSQEHIPNTIASMSPSLGAPRDPCQALCRTMTNGGDRSQTAESTPLLLELPLTPFQSPGGSYGSPHGTQMFSPQGSSDWAADMDHANGVWCSPASYFPEGLYGSYPTTPLEAASTLIPSQTSTTGYLKFDAVGTSAWADPSPSLASETDMYWDLNQPYATMQSFSSIDAFQSSHHVAMHPYSAAGGAADYHHHLYHHHHHHLHQAQSTAWQPTGDPGDTQTLLCTQGTVNQSAGTGAGGSKTSGPGVEMERRKRGRPRLYLTDGTRAAGKGSSTQQHHTLVAIPADKGLLDHPPLDSVALDGTAAAAGDTSYIHVASSSRETPPSPRTGRPSRPRVTDPDKAAHTRARNKVAATRYRTKTQTNIAKAEEKEREAEFQRNAQLACVDQLREEVLQLKKELLEQASCGCPLIQGYLSDVTRTLYPSACRREHPEHPEHPEHSNHAESCDNSGDLQRLCQPHQHHHQLQPPPQEIQEPIAESSTGGGGMTTDPHQMRIHLPDRHQMVMMPLPHPESQLYPYKYQ